MIKIERYQKKVGDMLNDMPLEINFTKIKSGIKWPRVYIQSWIHGGEVTHWIIHRLYQYLKESSFKWEIIFCPLANPLAWLQRVYFNTAGKFNFLDGKDWNRHYPGDKEKGLPGRIANVLFKEASASDLVIDLHTSRWSEPFNIIFSEKYLELAKTTDIKYTYFPKIDDSKKYAYSTTLSGLLTAKDIDNITIECGSHDSYNINNIKSVVESLKNLLKAKGVLDWEISNNVENHYCYNSYDVYHAPVSGIGRLLVDIGSNLKKNEDLYLINDTVNLDKEIIIKSKEDIHVLKCLPTHNVFCGDEVMMAVQLDKVIDF